MRTHGPGYKREFCDAFPVKMRLAGWEEDACLAAEAYVRNVAATYTGNAWRNYARDCDVWLAKTTPGLRRSLNAILILPNFPRRSGVWIPPLTFPTEQKEPS